MIIVINASCTSLKMEMMTMTVNNIVSLPISELVLLKNEIEALLSDIKKKKETLEEALDLRYNRKAKELLADAGQNTGTIHFFEGAYTISAVIPKKVNWDQAMIECALASMTHEQVSQYIDITYKVHETKYLAHCPASVRSLLEPAREVIVGKAKFTIELDNK